MASRFTEGSPHLLYPNLFKPLRFGSIVLKNRIIVAPVGNYIDSSQSGAAMIIRGTCGSVDDGRSRMAPGGYCFGDVHAQEKIRRELTLIRQRGARAEFELCHVGQYATNPKDGYAIGPVSLVREDGTEVRAMDSNMMEYIVERFVSAALDVKSFGLDAILLHFSHGWLPSQFMSPYFNKRTDEYGGSFENRIRFPKMIVEAVRKALGPDYPLDMRISGEEHVPGGMHVEEVAAFIHEVEEHLDMVHISCGIERIKSGIIHMSTTPFVSHMCNTGLSEIIKKAVKIPVAVVGAIMTPEEGEKIIASGKADAVVIGRQMLADPDWVKNAWEGRAEDTSPCLRCLNCYGNVYPLSPPVRRGFEYCSVNPRAQREDTVPRKLARAEKQKKVVVVGGGPAGMKAALTARERGHEVILFEKNASLGGQTRCADYDGYKADLKRYRDYLIYQLRKSGTDIRLSVEVTSAMVAGEKPDSLILALGAVPSIPKIPGLDEGTFLTAVDAYPRISSIGKQVFIIGGGSIGCELALLLGELGREVVVAEMGPKLCANLNEYFRDGLFEKLDGCSNVSFHTSCEVTAVSKNSATLTLQDGSSLELAADTVIIATGLKALRDKANDFYGIVQDTNSIGDCNSPGTILEAVEDAYFICATL